MEVNEQYEKFVDKVKKMRLAQAQFDQFVHEIATATQPNLALIDEANDFENVVRTLEKEVDDAIKRHRLTVLKKNIVNKES